MRVSRIQAILSILVVAVFLFVTCTIALTPVIGGYPSKDYTEHLKTFASLYSGIVGLVLGYYFGQKASAA
jgi:hypothetical protein